MKKALLLIAAGAAACAATWATDFVVERAAGGIGPQAGTPPARDGSTLELGWDNGEMMYHGAWTHTRAAEWRAGNDFDTSTLKTGHVKILKFKTYSSDVWPNEGWDGFHYFIFAYRRGVPGEMLWPTSGQGLFFKPSGLHGHVWVECPVNWTCPTLTFVAARDQCYNYPDCDPFSVDTNPTYLVHSWMYVYGYWSGYSETSYRNLMVRVRVETGYNFPAVAPTSLGRVKALYY